MPAARRVPGNIGLDAAGHSPESVRRCFERFAVSLDVTSKAAFYVSTLPDFCHCRRRTI
jgi:hypothetical protein